MLNAFMAMAALAAGPPAPSVEYSGTAFRLAGRIGPARVAIADGGVAVALDLTRHPAAVGLVEGLAVASPGVRAWATVRARGVLTGGVLAVTAVRLELLPGIDIKLLVPADSPEARAIRPYIFRRPGTP
jgi:hypothetical protein